MSIVDYEKYVISFSVEIATPQLNSRGKLHQLAKKLFQQDKNTFLS